MDNITNHYKSFSKKLTVIYFLSIPILTYIFFKLNIVVQKWLFQKSEELLYTNGFILVISLAYAFIIPFIIIFYILDKKYKNDFSNELNTTIPLISLNFLRKFSKFLVVLTSFLLILNIFLIHSYVKVTDSNVIVSKFNFLKNEKIYSFSEISSSKYVHGCQYFYQNIGSCLENKIKEVLGYDFTKSEKIDLIYGFCEKSNIPDYNKRIIYINLFGLIILGIFSVVAYLLVTERSKMHNVSIRTKRIIKGIFLLLPILSLIFVNLPILKDTIFVNQPIQIVGYASSAERGSGSATWIPETIYQKILIDGNNYKTYFFSEILTRGYQYRICYLPYSKTIVKVEIIKTPDELK